MAERAERGRGRSDPPDGPGERELAEILEFAEAHDLAEWFGGMAPETVERFGVRLDRIGSAVALRMGPVDVPMFNRIVGLGLREPLDEAALERVEALYRGGPNLFMVQLSPPALSDELHARLEARGLKRSDSWAKMIRGPEPPPEVPTDLRIEPVGPDRAEQFTAVLCEAFGMPPDYAPIASGLLGRPGWHHYAAFDGARMVATGALAVHDGVGMLGLGATLPSHRGRGAQGALMARRIRAGIALGCRWLTTYTGQDTPEQPNPSYRNMLRAGFRLAFLRPNYIFFRADRGGAR